MDVATAGNHNRNGDKGRNEWLVKCLLSISVPTYESFSPQIIADPHGVPSKRSEVTEDATPDDSQQLCWISVGEPNRSGGIPLGSFTAPAITWLQATEHLVSISSTVP